MPLTDDPERRPRTLGGVVYLVVVAVVAAGVVATVAGAWRTGLTWMGCGLLAGGACRMVLSERRAGMLRVRRRWSDVVMLLVAGAALVVLAAVIPDQPGA